MTAERSRESVPAPTVGAFVITFRRPDAAVHHVEVLLRQTLTPNRVIVIDNDADDQLAERVRRMKPGVVEYVAMSANLGPAGAAAFGVRSLVDDTDWIYWGDDDQPPESGDQLERLVEAGTAAGAAAVAMRGWRWSRRRAALVRVPDRDRATDGPVDIDATGGGMGLIVRAEVVTEVGLPRPEFFWGYEDIEYVLRIRLAGKRVIVAPGFWSTPAVGDGAPPVDRHYLAASGVRRTYFTVRNSLYMVLHLHRRPLPALRLAVRATASALLCFRRGRRYGFSVLRQTMLGLIDGLLGRLGGSSL